MARDINQLGTVLRRTVLEGGHHFEILKSDRWGWSQVLDTRFQYCPCLRPYAVKVNGSFLRTQAGAIRTFASAEGADRAVCRSLKAALTWSKTDFTFRKCGFGEYRVLQRDSRMRLGTVCRYHVHGTVHLWSAQTRAGGRIVGFSSQLEAARALVLIRGV